MTVATYVMSYVYLGFYHQKILLFNTVVHENGKNTFLETTFFASHFLGHIPVITVVALLFVGWYFVLFSESAENKIFKSHIKPFLVGYMCIFLILSLLLSVSHFGFEDTYAFILQKKQSEIVYTQGGSWNLHLPSTILLILFIPVYLITAAYFLKIKISISKKYIEYLVSSVVLIFLITFYLNGNIVNTFLYVWADPRYLSHSVRELATFPLTYFPVVLYIFSRVKKDSDVTSWKDFSKIVRMIYICALAIFFIGFLYQVMSALTNGIGNLSQKPEFVKGDSLPVSYLLAFHYFEHFMDTIYFILLSLFIYETKK